MKIVVKIGGAALEDKPTLQKCAKAVVQFAEDGHQVAVVHGGGSALTRTLELLGKKSDFVHGLRVTDAETRDVALMVLAGIVNKSLVAAIAAAGCPAIGLCGGDGGIFRARKKQDAEYDLGFVGEICFSEPRWLTSHLGRRRHSCALLRRARRRRAVLQRERGPDGGRLRHSLRGRRTDFSYRRGRGKAGRRCGHTAVGYERSGRTNRRLRSQRRDDAQTRSLHASSKSGVGRVRILPAAQVEMLPLFYFARLECGTEVLRA